MAHDIRELHIYIDKSNPNGDEPYEELRFDVEYDILPDERDEAGKQVMKIIGHNRSQSSFSPDEVAATMKRANAFVAEKVSTPEGRKLAMEREIKEQERAEAATMVAKAEQRSSEEQRDTIIAAKALADSAREAAEAAKVAAEQLAADAKAVSTARRAALAAEDKALEDAAAAKRVAAAAEAKTLDDALAAKRAELAAATP